jgi:hypothetical protein
MRTEIVTCFLFFILGILLSLKVSSGEPKYIQHFRKQCTINIYYNG